MYIKRAFDFFNNPDGYISGLQTTVNLSKQLSDYQTATLQTTRNQMNFHANDDL